MKTLLSKKHVKNILSVLLFIVIMALTFYTIFMQQDINTIWTSVLSIPLYSLVAAVILALLFVAMEGFMIWFLLKKLKGKSSLRRCISYSFIGFFFSGITPSATGGQPVQLYYMNKDGNHVSKSSAVLMTVAALYKFIVVLLGILILLLWYSPLKNYLKEYILLYYLGLILNIIVVGVLLSFMFFPAISKKALFFIESLLMKVKILKPCKSRSHKYLEFIDSYHRGIRTTVSNPSSLLFMALCTLLQRCTLFILTYVVYSGLSLDTSDFLTVVLLQASIFIAVDMLPVPGAQGITELMYMSVFSSIFINNTLSSSLLITRGISFYLILVVGLFFVLINKLCCKSNK